MGNGNSMFYAIGAFILLYLVMMGIYQLYLFWKKRRKDQ